MTKKEFEDMGLNIAYNMEIDSPMPLDEFLDKFYDALKVTDKHDSEEYRDAFISFVNHAREHLDEKQFGEFIYQMYTKGIENVSIDEIPIYKNVELHGHVVAKYIVGTRYAFSVMTASNIDKLEK